MSSALEYQKDYDIVEGKIIEDIMEFIYLGHQTSEVRIGLGKKLQTCTRINKR
jgi:hypothetical protein